MNRLEEIFTDQALVEKVKKKLPYLFQLAELEASRAGKVGMEVGSVREKIIIALLIYKFGKENVETEIPITEPEVDVKVFGEPVSIKTVTKNGGIKAVWTVDALKAREFLDNYSPVCDMLVVRIKWGGIGYVSYVPVEVQQKTFNILGGERYFRLPKEGTNPRGVEFSREAMAFLLNNDGTIGIDIYWRKSEIKHETYQRWVDLWNDDSYPP